jgi:hypothetical protein
MEPRQMMTLGTFRRWFMSALAVLVELVAGVSIALAGQSPPPVRGTIALEGTVAKIYAAANTVIVETIDGVEHVVHFTKDLLVHGGKGTGVDALRGLREGSTVVVHYRVEGGQESAQEIDSIGDEGLKVTEGVVARIDRGQKQITIRFDNGTTETLRLTDRAAADVGRDIDQPAAGDTRVVVYYSDDSGSRVAHFFKRKS